MFLNFALFRNALLSADEMRECVEAFVSDVEVETEKIPFGAAAVDLIAGKQIGKYWVLGTGDFGLV